MPPEFIVIAGPNGAGKSTTSRNILTPYGIEAFDWDKEFHKKWNTFEFDPTLIDGIRDSVNDSFQNHIELAFSTNQSVAYETNFHSVYNIQLAKKARKLGYRTSLYFLALSDVRLGINRVKKRVKEGGHHVSNSTIKNRYKTGLKFLDQKAIDNFDRIFIYDSGKEFTLQIAIEYKEVLFVSKSQEPKIIDNLPTINSLVR